MGGCRSPISLSPCLSSFSKILKKCVAWKPLKACCCDLPTETVTGSPPQCTAGTAAETSTITHLFCFLFYLHLRPLPLPRRHHFFQRVFRHPSSPSSARHLLHPGGEGVIGVEHERVPLSLATATGAGTQVPTQGVPGGTLLHDPLQHLSDPAGHIYTGLRRAPVPQQLYVQKKHNFTVCSAVYFILFTALSKCMSQSLVIECLP